MQVNFDGCYFGHQSTDHHLPIRKPWTFATDNPAVYTAFQGCKCPGHSQHQPCEGSQTKGTENYTPSMVSKLHQALAKSAHRISHHKKGAPAFAAAPTSAFNAVPAMPCQSLAPMHRIKVTPSQYPFVSMVARPVPKKEISSNPKAKASVDAEWEKLRKWNTWDETKPREKRDVVREARAANRKAHFGFIFPLCMEKGSELPDGDPGRKMKGRVVFGGDRVTDENYESAIFNDLSSSPSTMEGAKAVDVHACLPGHVGELADAPQAYTQTFLLGTETWVSMDKDQCHKSWHGKYDNPLAPLLPALHGTPEPRRCWQRHSQSR